jgi:hypothetical protein
MPILAGVVSAKGLSDDGDAEVEDDEPAATVGPADDVDAAVLVTANPVPPVSLDDAEVGEAVYGDGSALEIKA